MRRLPKKRIVFVISALLAYGACSDVEFKKKPHNACKDLVAVYGKEACTVDPETGKKHLKYEIEAGEVDILVVDDNSHSMYPEQTEMGNRFPDFINSMSNIDYRIGIITTDVSASPNNSTPKEANGNGAFQDGKLLTFPNGSKYITRTTPNAANEFMQNITREETLNCIPNVSCPSPDERGIYAAILAMERQEASFFRADAHLAVVILSDEDERSNSDDPVLRASYPIEDYDKPSTFVEKVGEVFGPVKTVSVHAVIVKPGDTACKAAQDSQGNGVKGFYGYHYANLANPNANLKSIGNIIDGELGSICASNYGNQLGSIGSKIGANVNQIQLACAAENLEVSFSSGSGYSYTVDAENRLIFSPPVPSGITVSLEYNCPGDL